MSGYKHDGHGEDYYIQEGFIVGDARCLNCGEEWRCALEQIETGAELECPACHEQRSKFCENSVDGTTSQD